MENTTSLQKDLYLAEVMQQAPVRDTSDRRNKVYKLGPMFVCAAGLRGILGIGETRSKRLKHGKPDMRFGKRPKGDLRGKAPVVFGRMFSYLWQVYTCVAEHMPDEIIVVNAADPLVDVPDSMQQEVVAFSSAARSDSGNTITPASGGVQTLPRKRLPPGSKKEYWWCYRSTCNDEFRKVGSYKTCSRVWQQRFAKLLAFRDFKQHACCNTCAELKDEVRFAATYSQKIAAAAAHAKHLEQQWRDRLVYWRLRAASQQSGSSWLTIIVDGADQAKFRVLKATEWPKALETEWRPKVKVVGCLAHGHHMSFTFVEENVPKGSNLTIEILVRALDRIYQDLADRGEELPAHLWVQADNASGENKNQWLFRFLAVVVDRGVCRSAVMSMLQVGHTHEDIDAIFGVMSMEIAKTLDWDTPMQMAEHLGRSYVCTLFNMHMKFFNGWLMSCQFKVHSHWLCVCVLPGCW